MPLTILHTSRDPAHPPILAHELRGPLTPIRYAAAALSMQHEAGAPTRKAVDLSARQLSSIESIIENVLDAARRHHDLAPVVRVRFDLGTAVADAVAELMHVVVERGHVLVCERPATPMFVDGNAQQIIQLVSNLVTPGRKARLARPADSASACTLPANGRWHRAVQGRLSATA